MSFELLNRLRPDHVIELDLNNYVLSIDKELLEQINPEKISIIFNIPCGEFFNQFNKNRELYQYTEEFINKISLLISQKNHALMLLNSNLLKNTQTKGLYLFIIKIRRNEDGIILEFYNLLDLSNLVINLFSIDLWRTLKRVVSENNHCFVNQQLYLAYEAILPLFLLTNTSEVNLQSKPKWHELGEVLYYFNPYSKNKKISSTSGRNLMSDGLVRSANELAHQFTLGLTAKNQKLIPGNLLTNNQIIILN
jgi:hypothetical protein